MRGLGLIAFVLLLTVNASAAQRQRLTKKEAAALNRPLVSDAMNRRPTTPVFAMPAELDATRPIALTLTEDSALPGDQKLVSVSYVLNDTPLETTHESPSTSQTVFRGKTVSGANTLVVTATVLVPKWFGQPEEVRVTWVETFTASPGNNVALAFRLHWDWNFFRSAQDRLQGALEVSETPIEAPKLI